MQLALSQSTLIGVALQLAHFTQLISSLAINRNPAPNQQLTATRSQSIPKQHIEFDQQQDLVELEQRAGAGGDQNGRRPIWSLAHMVNSIKELDYRLSLGANAIEVDVTFNTDGVPLYTYHGPPCDCWRHCYQQEDFNEYLTYVREIALDEPTGIGQNLSILFLDLKLDYLTAGAKIRAGKELAKSILEHLYVNNLDGQMQPPLRLVVSVNHVTDIDLVRNFHHFVESHNATRIMQFIGFDVGMNDDIQQIESMWRRFGQPLNLWQGDGYTNCLSPFYNLERLSRAIAKRDSAAGYPAKVYHWTIDLHDRIRESLVLGVDAIMTNHPERLITILAEPEIARDFRLARREDNPFKKITRRPTGGRSSETARYQRSASPSAGGFLASLLDVVASWLSYVKEIPFLSLPTTFKVFSQFSSEAPKSRRIGSKHAATKVQYFNGPTSVAPEPAASSSALGHQLLQAKSQLRTNSTNSEAGGSWSLTQTATSSPVNSPRNTNSSPQTSDLVQSTSNTASDGAANLTSGTPEALAQTLTDEPPHYDGPKWYTNVVSNVLVAMMKSALP